jgi:hypothetical protein
MFDLIVFYFVFVFIFKRYNYIFVLLFAFLVKCSVHLTQALGGGGTLREG